MVEDIFDFWLKIDRAENIHPADREVFRRLGSEGHRFNLKCLPAHFMGPLRTAKVVLLYMSPGFSVRDVGFARSKKGQDYYVRRRKGKEPLPQAMDEGGKWWVERTKCFKLDQEIIAKNFAILNIGAYHSEEMNDTELLAALPSSRVSLDWAQQKLFPEAETGRRVVVCMRAAKFWGLKSGQKYKGTLFAPEVTRGGHMHKGPEREKIIRAVRKIVNGRH